MKLTFSTENVKLASFLSLCRYADDYGFSGIEISDAVAAELREVGKTYGVTADF